jgi:biuret amidohydrolase
MVFEIENLLQPGRVALLLSEVQRGIIGDKSRLPAMGDVARKLGVIPNSARLAEAARRYGVPVIHCLAHTDPARFGANKNSRLFRAHMKNAGERPPYDPEGDQPCPEVYKDGDIILLREQGLNPMADSSLERRLRNSGITALIVAGVSLNIAIPNLTMDAVNSGYQVIIARDAVSGYPLEYGEPMLANTLGIIATLATVDDIIAAFA